MSVKSESIKHETKTCPCCKKDFECKSGSINLCQCTEVKLSVKAREILSDKYNNCLCKECLLKIGEGCEK